MVYGMIIKARQMSHCIYFGWIRGKMRSGVLEELELWRVAYSCVNPKVRHELTKSLSVLCCEVVDIRLVSLLRES